MLSRSTISDAASFILFGRQKNATRDLTSRNRLSGTQSYCDAVNSDRFGKHEFVTAVALTGRQF